MADKITLTGVIVRSFGRKASGGVATFSAAMSAKLIAAMGWHEMPDSETGADLTGDLTANSLTVTPAAREMRHNEFELSGGRAHKFQAVRREVDNKKGKGTTVDVFFKVKFSDPNGCAKLETYMLTVGEAKSSMSISYASQTSMFVDPVAATSETEPADNLANFPEPEPAAAVQ